MVRRIRTIDILLYCIYDTFKITLSTIQFNPITIVILECISRSKNGSCCRIFMPDIHFVSIFVRPIIQVTSRPLVIHHTIRVILTTRSKCIITTIFFVEMVTIYLRTIVNVYNRCTIRLDCNIFIHRVISVMVSFQTTRSTTSHHTGSDNTLNGASSARNRIDKRPTRRRSINTICMMSISPSLS